MNRPTAVQQESGFPWVTQDSFEHLQNVRMVFLALRLVVVCIRITWKACSEQTLGLTPSFWFCEILHRSQLLGAAGVAIWAPHWRTVV